MHCAVWQNPEYVSHKLQFELGVKKLHRPVAEPWDFISYIGIQHKRLIHCKITDVTNSGSQVQY